LELYRLYGSDHRINKIASQIMMKYTLLLIISIIFASGRPVHDVHVSVTDINVEANGKFTLTSKIFFDDLQLAMGLEPGGEIPAKYKGSDDLISKFVQKNIKVKIDNQFINIKYLSSKAALPAIWAYTEGKILHPEKIKTIEIINTILANTYDDQVNMVNINLGGKTFNFALNSKVKQKKIEL
jgi:hypothetical protein